MRKAGFLDQIEGYLKEAGMEVRFFEGVEPDPSVETVMRGAKAMQEFEPDWIVAIGGAPPSMLPRQCGPFTSIRIPPSRI